jgi:uncharacterized protein (TIGR02099 family)
MLHLFRSAVSRAITLGLVALLVAGLLIGAVGLALPFADQFRSELESLLSETLGLQVRIGHLGLRLAGVKPRLTLENAELLDPETGRQRLSLKELRIELNLAASLREMAYKIDSVTLEGAQLVVKRLQDGRIVLSGLEGLKSEHPEALTFFFGNGRFQLEDSDLYWIDEKVGAPALQLTDVRVLFENAQETHRLAVLGRFSDDPGASLRLAGDLRGQPDRPQHWNGKLYLHWKGRNLELILAGRLPPGLHIGSDSVELESWSRLEDGLIAQSLNRIGAKGLRIRGPPEDKEVAPLRVDRLTGLLRWQPLGDGWQLQATDLSLLRAGAQRPPTDLEIRFAAGTDGSWTIEGGSQFLDISDAGALLGQLTRILPEALQGVGDLRPNGKLHELRFRFLHTPELPPQWAGSGRVEDLSLDARGRFPGIRHLTAKVAGNEREGSLLVSARDLALDLPLLFPDPIRSDETNGEIRWRRGADGALRIEAGEVTAVNADISTRSRFSISIPAGGGAPFLDLQTHFADGQAASVRRYIPSKRIKEKLTVWLDRAFVKGRIPSGTLLFRGSVADFPFDEQEGRFQVLLDVEDCTLDYHADWPRIQDVDAQVRFENRGMEILASKGRFLDSALSDVTVRIPNLGKAVALDIQGRSEGPFADGLRALGETPLREKLGALAGIFAAKGVAHLDLDLAIPLPHKGRKSPLRVSGELTWPSPAALAIPGQNIRLTDLRGVLRFTESSLEAESIDVRLWDVPIRVHVETLHPQGSTATFTSIRADGRFPVAILAQQFPSSAWKQLKGRAQLELRLDVGNADLGDSVPPIDFQLTSSLAGLAIGLPAPLGKPASASRSLKLSGRLVPKGAPHVQGNYGDLGINLGLERDGRDKLRLARGIFNLGGAAVPLPKGEGLHLRGSVALLDLQSWLDWWENSRQPARGDSRRGTRLRSADLQIGQLFLSGAALDEVRLDLASRGDGWEASIRGRDLEGKVTIPDRSRREPVQIVLERLDLKGLLGERRLDAQTRTASHNADPRRAPTLDLQVERLLWGENLLGSVSFRSQAVPEGLDFTEIRLTGPLMSIEGRGRCRQTEAGPHSWLALTAKGSDLGEALRSLGYESLFYKAPAEVALDLDWLGGLVEFSAADLRGRIRVAVGAGSLLDIEPGVGRVLGILNLEALQRRLTLDFSDLFGRGFAFEKISGELKIAEGEATIEKLVIEGPSADISIAGSANLVDKELDQIVTVTPRIGTGVAIASAVAGGPLVGAVVFLADKVSGGAVDKLGRHQYLLTGPWAQPEILRGKLGTDLEKHSVAGHFLQHADAVEADDSRGSKPGGSEAGTSAQEPHREQVGKPPSSQRDDVNPFLESY